MNKLKAPFTICLVFFFFTAFCVPVFAGNPPDQSHSSMTSNSPGAADGTSQVSITVTLQDSSGNAVTGDTVTLSAPNDNTAVFSPTSTTLDSSGKATFNMTSTTQGTDQINVTDTTTTTTLSNIGTVTFGPSFSTPTPTPSCVNSAPSAPTITAASSNTSGQITLTWTDSPDPVSYYLISYGIAAGNYIYGVPNAGPQGTTSYTIGALANGKTYYFAVRAVNGCTPSIVSNEMSAVAGTNPTDAPDNPGATTNTNSSGSGTSDVTPTDTPAPTETPAPSPSPTATPAPSLILGLGTREITLIAMIAVVAIATGIFTLYSRKKNKEEGPDQPSGINPQEEIQKIHIKNL